MAASSTVRQNWELRRSLQRSPALTPRTGRKSGTKHSKKITYHATIVDQHAFVYSRKTKLRQAADAALRINEFRARDLSPKVMLSERRCYHPGKNLLRQNAAVCYKPMIFKRLL